MSNADRATDEATQKPATVAVAASGRVSRTVVPTELDVAPAQAESSSVDALKALLTEALTVLTIYAEVAVPVVNYRGQPMAAHAPRELVERIHRAIG
jgi:hypothetical protein